jgi:hypothetical protein
MGKYTTTVMAANRPVLGALWRLFSWMQVENLRVKICSKGLKPSRKYMVK